MSVDTTIRAFGSNRAAQLLGVAGVELDEIGVVDHRQVIDLALDGQLAAGRDGAGLEAAFDALGQIIEAIARVRADHEGRGCMSRNDVRGVAALGHDAVDPIARGDLLPQRADRDLRDRKGVGGIDAELRVGGGMGFAADVGHASAA